MEMLAGASLVEQEVKDLVEFAAKTHGQEIIKILSWVDFRFGNSSSKATKKFDPRLAIGPRAMHLTCTKCPKYNMQ